VRAKGIGRSGQLAPGFPRPQGLVKPAGSGRSSRVSVECHGRSPWTGIRACLQPPVRGGPLIGRLPPGRSPSSVSRLHIHFSVDLHTARPTSRIRAALLSNLGEIARSAAPAEARWRRWCAGRSDAQQTSMNRAGSSCSERSWFASAAEPCAKAPATPCWAMIGHVLAPQPPATFR